MLVLVNVNNNGKLVFQICELPVKSVLELKFTYQNDIIFLGNNRILYAISAEDKGKLVEIFNQSDRIVHFCLFRASVASTSPSTPRNQH